MTFDVVFDPRAEEELVEIGDFIVERTGNPAIAQVYVLRLVDQCRALSHFPARGTRRDDIRPGLRTMGFERRVTIAFTVQPQRVVILRILYAGRQFQAGGA